MSKTQIKRLLSILDFFAGLFFGLALFCAYLAFQMVSPLIASIFASVLVFAVFSFLMVMVRYFIARIYIADKQTELLERILDSKIRNDS